MKKIILIFVFCFSFITLKNEQVGISYVLVDYDIYLLHKIGLKDFSIETKQQNYLLFNKLMKYD